MRRERKRIGTRDHGMASTREDDIYHINYQATPGRKGPSSSLLSFFTQKKKKGSCKLLHQNFFKELKIKSYLIRKLNISILNVTIIQVFFLKK